jgi:phosphodiesterase/alkaline phosphatase D-like protein
MLGPFLGQVTTESIKVWLHLESVHEAVWVTLHPQSADQPSAASARLEFKAERLFTDCVELTGLRPDTRYFYKLWTNPALSLPLDLQGLEPGELQFRTLPADPAAQIDFVVMSCHNPTVAMADGFEGHAVWADLPQIISSDSNQNVRFALMVGDQVYADEWQAKILAEPSEQGRLALYLEVYRKFWSNIHYRRVLCRLPAMMIWDDHDITDGWGSELSSFVGDTAAFKPEWTNLFQAAFRTFSVMQASRNPAPLAQDPRDGLDFGFRVGPWGFIFLDLRTNRNVRLRRLLTPEQAFRIRQWVEANSAGMQTLFVVSPVVFSHGSPLLEEKTTRYWPFVMSLVDFVAKRTRWGKGLHTRFSKSVGDIRDDIADSWGSPENAAQADEMLGYLFDLQNDAEQPTSVIILSGDIHTSGYANIYSADPAHKVRASIPHITSSSVSYTPFNWLLEAIYRYASKTVELGHKKLFSSQVSHHFSSRSVAVLSLRPMRAEGDFQLKVKYYLEGYPEPQTLIFDLARSSHREDIAWVAQSKLFAPEFAPTSRIDVDAVLREKARTSTTPLNWRESIVDLMKLLDLDSSLGARKRLAQEWGYTGPLNGSAAMNVWLHQQIVAKFQQAGGTVPEAALPNGPRGTGEPA